jgi:hypothetical protein
MGFKKNSGKKDKKKSKKGKSTADREWTLEGGQFMSSTEVQDDSNETKNRRRETQDRDERMRRGRQTLEERKRKRESIKKMSKALTFNKALGLETENEKQEEVKPKRARIEPPTSKSSLSILERLKNMVRTNKNSKELTNSTSDDENVSDEDEHNYIGKSLMDDEYNDNDKSILDDDVDEDSAINVDCKPSLIYDYEFTGDVNERESIIINENLSRKGMKLNHPNVYNNSSKNNSNVSRLFQGDSLHGWLCDIAESSARNITQLSHIPHLHKMWKNEQNTIRLSNMDKSLLPILTLYADTFIEGRTHINDHDIMRSVMLHITTHIVHAR